MNSIFLIGYMGCGKSTIGKSLAKNRGIDFIDIDQYIEKQEGTTAKNLFEQKGELYFRKLERQVLMELLQVKNPAVIALGGGTPCYFDNMEEIVNSPHFSFYLNVPISILVERLAKEKAKRPLIAHLKDEDALTEFVGKHLFERNPFYRRAKYNLAIGHKSPKEIVTEIEKKLG